MIKNDETIYDYTYRLHFEGNRTAFLYARIKLNYILKKIRKYLKPSLSACDIGIGDGYVLTKLNAAGLKVTGVEISNYAVEYLRGDYKKKGLDIKLIQGDISEVSPGENCFDIVTCFDVLEHIPAGKQKSALDTIKRSFVKGG